jgi:hypothetical protein
MTRLRMLADLRRGGFFLARQLIERNVKTSVMTVAGAVLNYPEAACIFGRFPLTLISEASRWLLKTPRDATGDPLGDIASRTPSKWKSATGRGLPSSMIVKSVCQPGYRVYLCYRVP